MVKTEKEQVPWRVFRIVSLFVFIALYLVRRKIPRAFEVLLPLIALLRVGSAVMLKKSMLQANKTFVISPGYLLLNSVVSYVVCLCYCNRFLISTLLLMLFSSGTDALTIYLIDNEMQTTPSKFPAQLLYMFFFLKLPAAWLRYSSMRRDVESFIQNCKTRQERNQLEAIIQFMPDSLIVVGPPPKDVPELAAPELQNHSFYEQVGCDSERKEPFE